MGGIVDEASGTGATSLIAFITGSRDDQVDYVKSMMGVGIFFIVIVALWFLTLWLLKCGGKDRMGCAAGYGFHDTDSDKEEDLAERRKWKQQNGNFNSNNKDTLFKGDGGAVSVGAAYTGGASVALDAGNDDDDDNSHRSNSFFGFMGGTVGRNSSGHTQDTAVSRRQELTTLAMKNTIDKNGDFQYDSDGSPTEEIDAISHYVEPDAPFSPPKSRSSRTTVSALYSIPNVMPL